MDNHIKPFKGVYRQQLKYKSFLPPEINTSLVWTDYKIDVLLEKAVRLIGELNVYSRLVPDVDFFIKMHVVKEATSSSRIEGIKTQLDEAFMSEDEIDPEDRDDWEEVQNYIQAMHFSIKKLEKLPISIRLLRQTHQRLLTGVRGAYKQPGKVRTSQNWIGGSGLSDAFFIPPHQDDVPSLLSDLEKFWHNESLDLPLLIKIAIAHYQFETIHPFLDGNGRIGRLLIVLQLIEKRYLQRPTLYISDFFEKNKGAYYDALTQVRVTGTIDQWIKFFLNAVIETATKGTATFESILALREKYEQKILRLGGRAELASLLLRVLYSKPRMGVNEISTLLNTSYVTANDLAKDFEKLGLLKETTGYSRNRIYALYEYLDLFKR
jgi:Fic family protein